MLIVCDQEQKVVARIKANPGYIFQRTMVTTANEMSQLFKHIKRISPQLIRLSINYPAINDSFHTLNEENSMDIESIVESYNARSLQNKDTKVSKSLFIAPVTSELPSDGVLNYVTIESVFDLNSVPDRSVVLIRDDQTAIVKCIAENAGVFDLKFATLTGLPTADYTVAFEEAVWAFDKVAYAPFISELRVAGEIEEQLASQNRTVHEIEKEKYTRKTGDVKAHSDFKIVAIPDDHDFLATSDNSDFRI